jgi:dihydrofolate synthase/folylpolyglutamate synthase
VRLPGLSVAMLGRHQAANAAVALATVGRLRAAGWEIPEAALREGLARVHCPARTELVQRQPAVILDAAHNVASIAALIDVLNENFAGARRRILVLAASKDKDALGMLRALLPAFDVVVVTRFLHNPRWTEPETLAETARQIARETGVLPPGRDSASQPRYGDRDAQQPRRFLEQLLVRPDPLSAWETARALATDDDLICIAGSFFLAAELRPVVTALGRPSGHPQPRPHPVGRNEGRTGDQ